MQNLTRLRRVSWKSKNNIYVCGLKNINDLGFQTDIILIPEGYQFNNRMNIVDIIEIDNDISQEDIDMKENIKKIDNIEVNNYIGKASNYLSNLGEKYFWKNIVIFEPKF